MTTSAVIPVRNGCRDRSIRNTAQMPTSKYTTETTKMLITTSHGGSSPCGIGSTE